MLKFFHWFPLKYHSIFKAFTIVYKYLDIGLPKYFSPCLIPYTSSVNTRGSNPRNSILQEPSYISSVHILKMHFDKSFAYDGTHLWNELPLTIDCAPSLRSFRNKLQSYLFDKVFPP